MVEQLELLFAKQRELRNLTNEVVGSLKDPLSTLSLQTMGKLLEGGSTEEQINLLQKFGV